MVIEADPDYPIFCKVAVKSGGKNTQSDPLVVAVSQNLANAKRFQQNSSFLIPKSLECHFT